MSISLACTKPKQIRLTVVMDIPAALSFKCRQISRKHVDCHIATRRYTASSPLDAKRGYESRASSKPEIVRVVYTLEHLFIIPFNCCTATTPSESQLKICSKSQRYHPILTSPRQHVLAYDTDRHHARCLRLATTRNQVELRTYDHN